MAVRAYLAIEIERTLEDADQARNFSAAILSAIKMDVEDAGWRIVKVQRGSRELKPKQQRPTSARK